MKHIIIYCSIIFLYSCNQQYLNKDILSQQIIPNIHVDKLAKSVIITNNVAYFNSKTFSGFLYELYPNSMDTFSVAGYIDGHLHGICKKWYQSKQLSEQRNYYMGKKQGLQTVYWPNGSKKFEFIAQNDAYEGLLQEWTYDAKLIHVANYKNGQEEGAQKLWYDNGKIRANYVILNGKRYGLLGTKNCKNVSDSIFIVK
jgi:antitoxin component YwqK of YwqJK toxin-antitoxin module